MSNLRSRSNGNSGESLLELHRKHLGLYRKVADSLMIAPSYVSLVANGARENKRIMAALVMELRKATPQSESNGELLLNQHRKHGGLYQKVADSLSVSLSYVHLVANGKRRNDKIMETLLTELRKINK